VHTAALLHRFADYLRAADVSPTTLRLRLHYLDRLAEHLEADGLDLPSATPGALVAFLARPGWSPETRKSARATVRRFYGWALDEGVVDVDPARRLPAVRVPRAVPRPTPLKVFAEALLRAGPRGRRALLLARYAGLRRAEVAALHTDDVVETPIGPAVRVVGKGRRVRVVPLHPRLAEALAGLPRGYVFPSTRTPAGHLSPDALGSLVGDLLGPGWTMHTLRHRAAGDWYAVDRDLRAVQELLGHASVATTQRYTPADDDAMWRAVRGVA